MQGKLIAILLALALVGCTLPTQAYTKEESKSEVKILLCRKDGTVQEIKKSLSLEKLNELKDRLMEVCKKPSLDSLRESTRVMEEFGIISHELADEFIADINFTEMFDRFCLLGATGIGILIPIGTHIIPAFIFGVDLLLFFAGFYTVVTARLLREEMQNLTGIGFGICVGFVGMILYAYPFIAPFIIGFTAVTYWCGIPIPIE